MPATSKSELLDVTEREYSKLIDLVRSIGPSEASIPDENGDSIRSVIGHRAHWIELFLGWYHTGQQGKHVHFPAFGYKWNQLKSYNLALREAQSDLTWGAAVALLEKRHAEITALVTELDNDALYGGPMKGAKNDWTTGRWAEAAGPSHYRTASKYLRQRLRGLRQARSEPQSV